jgi:hypothetical protein
LHAAGPAPADLQLDPSRASRRLPIATLAGDTAPTTAGLTAIGTAISTDSSPRDSGADSNEDFAETAGSPIAPGPSITVDNQQISLAHPYGTRLWYCHIFSVLGFFLRTIISWYSLMVLSHIQCHGFLPQNHHLMSLLWSIPYDDRL